MRASAPPERPVRGRWAAPCAPPSDRVARSRVSDHAAGLRRVCGGSASGRRLPTHRPGRWSKADQTSAGSSLDGGVLLDVDGMVLGDGGDVLGGDRVPEKGVIVGVGVVVRAHSAGHPSPAGDPLRRLPVPCRGRPATPSDRRRRDDRAVRRGLRDARVRFGGTASGDRSSG